MINKSPLPTVRAFVLLILFVLSNPTAAYSGNELARMCSYSDKLEKLSCVAYIKGVADILRSLTSAEFLSDEIAGICIQGGGAVSTGDTVDVVTTYLKNNPDLRQYPSDLLIYRALVEAYPCK